MRRKRSLATVALVCATVAILPLTITGLWACGWYSDPSMLPRTKDFAGVARGKIWQSDVEARIVRVSSNLFGIGAVPFAITVETRVVVGGKEGGFGDLYEGAAVSLAYERRDAGLVALCVESLDGARNTDLDGCQVTHDAALR